ncbi:MAG: FtsB family cell division protein [Gemmataceae bacterium]
MVVRRRLRAVVFPLLLYAFSGAADAYFIWHAANDDRGLKTNEIYERQIASLRANLTNLNADRHRWERRVALLSGTTIDRDLLDEEARARLGLADKNDLIVFFNPPTR